MSDAYSREEYVLSPFSHLISSSTSSYLVKAEFQRTNNVRNRQNNDLLSSLAAKSSALKHVTLNIYDNAQSRDVLQNTSETFSSMSTSLRGSAGRLTRMAKSGDKMAVLKLSAILVVTVVVLWWVIGLVWGLLFGK
jgi:blocked early in transport 1